MAQQQPHQPKMTSGPIDRVPCPHCGYNLDFRELHIQDGTTLYKGAEVSCEACNYLAIVKGVRPITLVTLEPTGRKAPIEEVPNQNQGQQMVRRPPQRQTFLQKIFSPPKRR